MNTISIPRNGKSARFGRRPPIIRVGTSTEPTSFTGPASLVRGQKLLVLADTQNIEYSARRLGFKASWKLLGRWIEKYSASVCLHAFLSIGKRNSSRARYFMKRGWTPHIKEKKIIKSYRGVRNDSNVDNLMLFWGGLLASRTPNKTILLLSGDGELVWDMAQAIKALPKRRRVLTMSLAGSTSWRLNSRNNSIIDGNLEIGRDCLRSMYNWRYTFR